VLVRKGSRFVWAIEGPRRETEAPLRLGKQHAVVVSVGMGPDTAFLCSKC